MILFDDFIVLVKCKLELVYVYEYTCRSESNARFKLVLKSRWITNMAYTVCGRENFLLDHSGLHIHALILKARSDMTRGKHHEAAAAVCFLTCKRMANTCNKGPLHIH